jgi:hypothetical protein
MVETSPRPSPGCALRFRGLNILAGSQADGDRIMDRKERDEIEEALDRLREARSNPGAQRPTATIHTLPMPKPHLPLPPG